MFVDACWCDFMSIFIESRNDFSYGFIVHFCLEDFKEKSGCPALELLSARRKGELRLES